MNRRTFLAVGTIGTAAVAIPAWYYLSAPELTPDKTRPADLGLIWEPDQVVAAGHAYRAAYPDEDSRRALAQLLDGVTGEQVKQDFSEGKTVMIDGWLLSVTESRQCALVSIDASSA